MADIQVKGSKAALRVDLTPMVDLGFLLIAFFMFTTTISDPKVMALQMPYESDEEYVPATEVKHSTAMTILLGKNHELYYYYGMVQDEHFNPEVEKAQFANSGGIRDAILAKKAEVQSAIAKGTLLPDDKMTVIIKASNYATADDFVQILDEMNINAVPVYTVADITTEELKMMRE